MNFQPTLYSYIQRSFWLLPISGSIRKTFLISTSAWSRRFWSEVEEQNRSNSASIRAFLCVSGALSSAYFHKSNYFESEGSFEHSQEINIHINAGSVFVFWSTRFSLNSNGAKLQSIDSVSRIRKSVEIWNSLFFWIIIPQNGHWCCAQNKTLIYTLTDNSTNL